MQSVGARDPILREIGPADELESGMRNTYKYTKMYSGGEPQFVESDVFRITIPLTDIATSTVGLTTQVATQVTTEDKDLRLKVLVEFCKTPRSKKMMEHLALDNANYFRKAYLKPLLESGRLAMTVPDKPNSSKQKYVRT